MVSTKGLLFVDVNNPGSFEDNFFQYPLDRNKVPHVAKSGDSLFLVDESNRIKLFDLTFGKRKFVNHSIRPFNLDTKKFIDKIRYIYVGQDSILWLSVKGEGVYFANMRRQVLFSTFHKNNLSAQPIYHLLEDEMENIIAITERGDAWQFDSNGNLLNTWTEKNRRYPRRFKQLQQTNGQRWAISLKGIGRWDPTTRNYQWNGDYAYPKYIFHDITSFKDRYLLLSDMDSLLCFDTELERLIGISGEELFPKLFIDSKNKLWAANDKGKLFVGKLQERPFRIQWQDTIHINQAIVNQIAEDTNNGKILIGTTEGLILLPITLDQDATILNEENGLINQSIQSIQMDTAGRIWMSTNRGITRLQFEKGNYKIRNFNARDGLSASEYSEDVVLLHQKSGKLFWGSSKGLDIIPSENQEIGYAPMLRVRALTANDSLNKNLNKDIVLNHDENNLTFELEAIEYTDPLRNQIEVFLINDNGRSLSKIIELGSANTYEFELLPPGKYEFHFTAKNSEGTISSKSEVLEFKIKPPFHKTIWFIALMFLLLLSLVVGTLTFIYRYRYNLQALELEKKERTAERQRLELDKEKAIKEERKQINTEFHDVLNSGLVTIRDNSILLKKALLPSGVMKSVDRIRESTANLLDRKKCLNFAMNPINCNLDALIYELRNYIAKFLENKCQVNFDIPDDLPQHAISSKAIYNILMTCRELVHNLAKNANCTQANFDVSLDQNHLQICISDNGCGFEFDEKIKDHANSFGLRNSIEWIQGVEGVIDWHNNQPSSTKVIIVLSLNTIVEKE